MDVHDKGRREEIRLQETTVRTMTLGKYLVPVVVKRRDKIDEVWNGYPINDTAIVGLHFFCPFGEKGGRIFPRRNNLDLLPGTVLALHALHALLGQLGQAPSVVGCGKPKVRKGRDRLERSPCGRTFHPGTQATSADELLEGT